MGPFPRDFAPFLGILLVIRLLLLVLARRRGRGRCWDGIGFDAGLTPGSTGIGDTNSHSPLCPNTTHFFWRCRLIRVAKPLVRGS